jgi:hypothetical protein
LSHHPARPCRCPRALTPLLGLWAAAAVADPGYYVVKPYDNEGLRTIDFRYWTTKPNGRVETIWPEVGLGLGVTSRWTTELFMSWIGSSRRATKPSTLNWQNEFLLTQGEWPLDLALHLQYVRDQQNSREHSIEFGPALQTDFGRWRLNANVFFERSYGSPEIQPTQIKYQWQMAYRLGPVLGLGAQGFGELGRWNDWSPKALQSNRAGPAVSGHWPLGDREQFTLQAALLMGKTYGREGRMFSLRAHTDF